MVNLTINKTIQTDIEVSNCPFCNRTNIKLINDFDLNCGREYRVVCKKCMSTGPISQIEEEACLLWNRSGNAGRV